MNRLFILLILFGSQIGLADFLQLPLLASRHGELSFLLLYAVFKLVIVLPLLHAELVAGRLHRVSPLELALEKPAWWARLLVVLLFMAAFLTLASHLHSSSWVLAMMMDNVSGVMVDSPGVQSTLYWYELSADRVRLVQIMVMQALLLGAIGWFAWRGAAWIYALMLPVCLLFILWNIPAVLELLFDSSWQWRTFQADTVLVALQYALTSSMAGFMIWYLVGSFLPESLPTGRWVLGVQLFDLALGITAVSLLQPVIGTVVSMGADTGQVLQALVQLAANGESASTTVNTFLAVATLVGVFDSLPLLLLFSLLFSGQIRRDSLFLTLLVAVPTASLLLLSAPGSAQLTWFGWPLSTVFTVLSLQVVSPLLALLMALWVGWVMPPNQVLKQVNPKTAMRYLIWRISLKFVIPVALALVFARASLGLVEVSPFQIALIALALLASWQAFRWVRA